MLLSGILTVMLFIQFIMDERSHSLMQDKVRPREASVLNVLYSFHRSKGASLLSSFIKCQCTERPWVL